MTQYTMNVFWTILFLIIISDSTVKGAPNFFFLRRVVSDHPNPDEIAELPYGDIDGVSSHIEYWPNALILFHFKEDTAIENDVKRLIWSAMEEIHVSTCVRFEETEPQPYSISINVDDAVKGCYSQLGRSKHSYIKLGLDCLTKGVIIHQLMHALGFIHEYNRPDRDIYVQIHPSNVNPKNSLAFEKFPLDYIDLANNYDYHSIMHASSYAFANGPKVDTVTSRLGSTHELGQRITLSPSDINRIRLRYNCEDPYGPIVIPTTTTSKPPTHESSTLEPTTTEIPVIGPTFPNCLNPDEIFFPHPTDCTKFFMCSHGTRYEMDCPAKTVFDPILTQCIWPKSESSCYPNSQ